MRITDHDGVKTVIDDHGEFVTTTVFRVNEVENEFKVCKNCGGINGHQLTCAYFQTPYTHDLTSCSEPSNTAKIKDPMPQQGRIYSNES